MIRENCVGRNLSGLKYTKCAGGRGFAQTQLGALYSAPPGSSTYFRGGIEWEGKRRTKGEGMRERSGGKRKEEIGVARIGKMRRKRRLPLILKQIDAYDYNPFLRQPG